MKVILHGKGGQFDSNSNPRKITIVLGEYVEFDITVNPLNDQEIIINKGYFGDGDSAISIKPRVSNEIQIG